MCTHYFSCSFFFFFFFFPEKGEYFSCSIILLLKFLVINVVVYFLVINVEYFLAFSLLGSLRETMNKMAQIARVTYIFITS